MSKLLLLMLLIGVSVAIFRQKKPECDERHRKYIDYGCLLSLKMFTEKIQDLKLTPQLAQEFKKTCNDVERCFFPFSCSPKKEERDMSRAIQIYCGKTIFTTTQFLSCSARLILEESECYKNWEPYPNVSSETDEDKKQEIIDDSCDNFFGVDNCLKEDITNTCGADKWALFRDNFFNLNPFMNNCSLDENPIFAEIPTTSEMPYIYDFTGQDD